MKSSALAAGLALLALALNCSAQEIVPPSPPAPPESKPHDKRPVEVQNPDLVPPCPPAIVLEQPTLVGIPVTPPEYPHVWMDMDGLLWWLKPNQIAAPLVTSLHAPEDLASNIRAGGLSDPNAFVIFGQQSFRTDPQVGGRVRIGAAFDTEAAEVVEASGFYMPWQVERFFKQSDAAGNPALALPFNEVFPGTPVETANIVAGQFDGRILHGNVLINNGTQLWGGEANYIKMLGTTCVGEFDLILGLRYLHMEDYLTIDASTDVADGGGSTHDRFDAKNSFYGGQIGVRHVLDCENWRFESSVKLALGDTNEVLDISGGSNLPLFAAGSTLPGGFYTASSNIGRTTTNRFGLVTEVGFNAAFKVCDNVQLTAGYTYLYWDHLYRSGNQIDHNLNPALNPALSTINPAGGPAAPQRFNAESSFWAQGINLGVRFTF
jgi:hypothetical protein